VPTKKFRLVNLNPVAHYNNVLPSFRSDRPAYYTRHNDFGLNRSTIEVAHRQRGRIIARHSLEETCDCCEQLNGKHKLR